MINCPRRWYQTLIVCYEALNSLASGRCARNIKSIIFKLIIVGWAFCHSLWNCSQLNATNLTNDNSTLVRVMAWCGQAAIHYLNKCWPRFISPQVSLHQAELILHNSVNNMEWFPEAFSFSIKKYVLCDFIPSQYCRSDIDHIYILRTGTRHSSIFWSS